MQNPWENSRIFHTNSEPGFSNAEPGICKGIVHGFFTVETRPPLLHSCRNTQSYFELVCVRVCTVHTVVTESGCTYSMILGWTQMTPITSTWQ